ncbi:MAG: hypothetical protein ACF8XB_16185 [Planctomycetota bacterium JB042]
MSTALLLDGMGRWSWDMQLRRAHNLGHRSSEFDQRKLGFDDAALHRSLHGGPRGAVATLVEHLRAHVLAAKPAVDYEVVLVGHSIGTVVMNDLLKRELAEDADRRLPITDIVYLGAAASIRETAEAIVPYLRRRPESRFHLLTLHPSAEADEYHPALVDIPPRGSLLEWIDHWYTRPPTHLDRRVGKWINVTQALHVFRDVRDRVAVKAFDARDDLVPQKHGDFDEGPFWRRSYWSTGGPLAYPPPGDG